MAIRPKKLRSSYHAAHRTRIVQGKEIVCILGCFKEFISCETNRNKKRMSGRAAVTKKEGKGLLAMVGIFVLWYGFSGSYNVYNQKMKPLNFPFVVCCIQFTMGLLYVLPMWALKLQEFPKV